MAPAVDTTIRNLGPCLHDSPLALNTIRGDRIGNFIADKTRIRHQVEIAPGTPADNETFFEKAGPRQKIFFDPRKTRAALVTCPAPLGRRLLAEREPTRGRREPRARAGRVRGSAD